jgi:predicted TIM-barrel fold metal-dependent hydrolase
MPADAYPFDPARAKFGFGAVDIVVNMYTPDIIDEGRVPTDENFRDKVRVAQDHRRGLTLEHYIEKMDRAGIDPTRGIAGLKELDRAVKEYGFVGAHLYPHWFGKAPDAAIYYPYYARCAELGIPIMMQVGHCLVYQKDRRLPSVGRPITLDQVAIDFPELTLIGIHLGYPWTEEMISVCTKHPNVFMAGDAYAPKHWGPGAVHYANTFGQDKFMFGTDWWVIDPERAVNEIAELDFRPASLRKIMRDNALRVFNI